MKVACIGNMNNNFFSVCRHLRDRGVDAHLLLLDVEMAHFSPASDTFDLSYQAFTRQLDWGHPYRFRAVDPAAVAADLAEFDFLIGCGSAPAFVHRAGRRLDLFVPYGADLFDYPFRRLVDPRHQLAYLAFSRAQREAIGGAGAISYDLTSPELEAGSIGRLRPRGKRLAVGIPMLYTPVFNPEEIGRYYDRTHWYHEFRAVREASEVMVFHHSRQYWTRGPGDVNHKGNDVLVRGLAEFLHGGGTPRTTLVMTEYGPDVAATRRLVAELGLGNNVRWFPQMARKDLMAGMSLADIGTGQFGGGWLSCGAIYESLAMAKPMLHDRCDERYSSGYPELYPLMNVRTPQGVAAALADYVARPAHFQALGERGRAWLLEYAIETPLREYMALIEESRRRVAGGAEVRTPGAGPRIRAESLPSPS